MKQALIAIVAASTALLLSSSRASIGARTQDSHQEAISEMLRQLYEDDQAVRASWSTEGTITPELMAEMHRGDEERRSEVLAIVADGMLSTGADHYHAAMILQHGGKPDDYLLSHVLATVGGFEGHEGSRWLAAAALDRFLHSIDRPQVFGTQYQSAAGGEWTQQPIDAALFTDSVRGHYGVPGLTEAAARLEEMRGR